MGTDITIEEHSVVVASTNQLSTEIPGEVVILNAETGMYHGMEAVGARIWQLLQRPRTVHDIQATLLKEYDVDPDYCNQDLIHLLQELTAAGLVEVSDT